MTDKEILELCQKKSDELRQWQNGRERLPSLTEIVKTVSSTPEFVMSCDTGIPDAPKPVSCEYCGKPRYHKGYRFGDTIRWATYGPERCDCPQAVVAYEAEKAADKARKEAEEKTEQERQMREHIRKLIGDSGMGRRFLDRTFANMQITPNNRQAIAAGERFADSFGGEGNHNSLLILGPPGTGKTHLAAAIANQLMQEGKGVICMTMIDLLARIKQTYNGGAGDESDVLEIYRTAPLLIIDDIGKEQPTEWAISTMYSIINSRYEAYMPVVITSNYNPDALVKRLTPKSGDELTAIATIDRLTEMCKLIVMDGESWRGRK